MKQKQVFMIVTFSLILFFTMNDVFALGVAPGKQIIDFKPGESKELRFMLINNEKQSFKAMISLRGELSEYITLYNSVVDVNENDKEKHFSYTLSMPETFNKPGIHEAEIVITILPTDFGEGRTVVGAYPAVISKVQLRVPYPDKYIEPVFQIYNTDIGDTTDFVLILSNFGMDEIKEAKADISIFNEENEKITTISTDSLSLKPNQLSKLVAKENLLLGPGSYRAIAILEYDGTKKTLEKEFRYGEIKIDILNISIRNFALGRTVPFDILIQNLWGKPIQDVFSEVIVRNKNEIISQFKTITVDVSPLSKETLTGYWETRNVPVGEHLMDVILHYGDKVSSKSFNISVSLDDAKLSTQGKVISEDKEESKFNFSIAVLTIFIIALIVVNVSLFFYIRRLVKK